MKFSIPLQSLNILQLLRRWGYSPANGQSESYVRRLGRAPYPHFHIYLREESEVVKISLHLDQKGACYRGQTAHSGEYGGQTLETEKYRILQLLEN